MFDSPGMIPANRDERKKVFYRVGVTDKPNLNFWISKTKKKSSKKYSIVSIIK